MHRRISDPITGGGGAIFWTITHYYGGIAKIFYDPVKGIIETNIAIPKGLFQMKTMLPLSKGLNFLFALGVMDIVSSVHEGLQNAPKLYGSEVRESGKVSGFRSGLKEAGKVVSFSSFFCSSRIITLNQGLFYGYYDGITGLVMEPVRGAQKEVRILSLLNHSVSNQSDRRDSQVLLKDRYVVVSFKTGFAIPVFDFDILSVVNVTMRPAAGCDFPLA